jgi:hypothetical protein
MSVSDFSLKFRAIVSCRWKMSFVIARMFDKQHQHVGWETLLFLKTKSVCHLYNPSRCVLLLKTVLSLGERYVQSVAMTTPSLCALSLPTITT